jgi:hypothetical protein
MALPSNAARLGTVLNTGLAAAAICLWCSMAVHGEFWRSDFSAFYTGWSIALDGNGDRLYDFGLQEQYQSRLLPQRAESGGLLPYVYPPPFVVFAPLACLPLTVAYFVWTAFQVALLALAVPWLWRDCRPFGPSGQLLAALTLLAFQPLFLTFQLGQQALISLVATYGLVRALRHDRRFQAGAWLALCTLKPQLAVLPVAYLIGSWRWRELLIASGLCAVWAAVVTAVLGVHCWTDFLALAAFHARQFDTYGVFPLRGHNLKMLFTAVLGSEHWPLVDACTAVAFAIAALSAVAIGYVARTAEEPARKMYLATLLFLAVLAAPHLNPHDDLLLAVPAILLFDGRRQCGRPTAALAALLVSCPLLFLFDSFGMDWWPSHVRPFFLVIVGLTVWAACDLIRLKPAWIEKREDRSASRRERLKLSRV